MVEPVTAARSAVRPGQAAWLPLPLQEDYEEGYDAGQEQRHALPVLLRDGYEDG